MVAGILHLEASFPQSITGKKVKKLQQRDVICIKLAMFLVCIKLASIEHENQQGGPENRRIPWLLN